MSFLQGFPLSGAIVNALAVLVGSLAGFALRRHVSEDLMKLPMQCLGLFTMALGAQMALQMQNMLVIIASLCVGSIVGGFIDIDGHIDRLIESLKRRSRDLGSNFSEGIMTATLIFCVGSMTVLGSLEAGLGAYPTLLLTKSMMDGLMSLALAATLGISVIFASVPVLLYEGALTLAARLIQPYMTEAAVVEMSATGGVLLIGLGMAILGIVKMKLMNSLPALVIAVVLARIYIG